MNGKGRSQKPEDRPGDKRVAVIVLKDTPDYRDWVAGLTEATMIPLAAIVRDALAKWATERGLPPPPPGVRRVGRPKAVDID